jgi:hypothetical protein
MTFLTSLCALTALAALVVAVAEAVGRRRADTVRRTLGLRAPTGRQALRAAAAAAAIAVLGVAAAQPALTHAPRVREQTGVEALFVLDTSRSMAASSSPSSPTRLDRAVAAAVRMRAAISDVPSGVATLTDRVLPDLLPVADVASFDAVARRAVAIESPPPADTAVRATTYAALGEIASGNYFAPTAARRLVVLLSDGESNPVDTGDLARALSPARGYRFLAVRFWHGGEAVYDADGKPETAYRPDPLGALVLGGVARALGGHAYEEGHLGPATAELRNAVGRGPTTSAPAGTPRRTPLAPYLAALALVLLLLALAPMRGVTRPVESVAR